MDLYPTANGDALVLHFHLAFRAFLRCFYDLAIGRNL